MNQKLVEEVVSYKKENGVLYYLNENGEIVFTRAGEFVDEIPDGEFDKEDLWLD